MGVVAVRANAGLGDAPLTDSSRAGVFVKTIHVTELRSALAAARATLGLTPMSNTTAPAAGSLVRAVDFMELRNGVMARYAAPRPSHPGAA